MERTMDRIADALGLDRALVRARNLIQPDQFPYDHRLTFQDGRPVIYDSGDYPGLLAKLTALVGWESMDERRREAETRGKLLGVGMALYVEGTGPGPYEGGHVQVLGSGKVLVSTGLTSQGQGHETVFAQIVATELGVPIEDVEVTTGDTRRFGYAVGTFASRAAVMSGNAIALAARGVREKAIRIAADVLEADPADLDIADGVVQVRGTPGASIPLRTVAVLSNPLRYAFDEAAKQATQFATTSSDDKPPVAEGDAPGLEHRDYYSPIRSTFASGAHAAVVEIDPATWEIDVVDYAVVHDCGNIVNPMIVEGQVHGGVAQGVGGALYERMAYDRDGQLQNASFMDFLMPYASEVPDVRIDHQQTPSPLNPLGLKGAGEAGVIPGTAAIASAIEDATGRRIAAMPISPTELYDLMRNENAERIARGTGVKA
jgi:CO/xanthine dehydrogenase Mo-binding subunit